MPDVTGQFRAAALQTLRASGFSATVTYDGETAAGGVPGTVVRQEPAAGASGQGTVTIVVHGRDVAVVVPAVTGLALSDAQAALAAVGLGSDVPAGTAGGPVVVQTPTAGASLEIGSLVHLEPRPRAFAERLAVAGPGAPVRRPRGRDGPS